ncbi:hypothetical protein I7I50_10388 [Histoplasma capsulatum G186AR]|uniref:Uncharacterized protein n=1 Tax=Ajellomyces capsulatus TaxID=5037 RepID=A0A8H7Z6D2_AJECA|nr:hypothetical protein I7I52_01627 [Histoplasma capsulatum]QSS69188.1 hypothetical protein I7I50_10388 [Histoplasma capsulatum G186AR]
MQTHNSNHGEEFVRRSKSPRPRQRRQQEQQQQQQQQPQCRHVAAPSEPAKTAISPRSLSRGAPTVTPVPARVRVRVRIPARLHSNSRGTPFQPAHLHRATQESPAREERRTRAQRRRGQ